MIFVFLGEIAEFWQNCSYAVKALIKSWPIEGSIVGLCREYTKRKSLQTSLAQSDWL